MYCEPAFFVGKNVFDKNLRILYEYLFYYMERNQFLDIYTTKYYFSMFKIFKSYTQIYTKLNVLTLRILKYF